MIKGELLFLSIDKLKNSNREKIRNLNFNKYPKVKLWLNLKTQIEKKTLKIQLWQILKSQIVTKMKNTETEIATNSKAELVRKLKN